MDGLNLLPWRDQLREEKKKLFLVAFAASVVLALVIIVLVHTVIVRGIEKQQQANNYINRELSQLNRQIAEIKGLKVKRTELIKRLQLISGLQSSRPLTVKFYDELVRMIPVGLYIESIARQKQKISLRGRAESNAPISEFMRNISKSPWFSEPVLNEVKTDPKPKDYSRDFFLTFRLRSAPMRYQSWR